MSPGATFERVYHELRRLLGEGTWPPGTPLEPTSLGEMLAASITPVRDALHRLTGERIVEAPNHNGFRVPQLSEAGLRDLYHWNGQLLILAVKIGCGMLGTPARQNMSENVYFQTVGLFEAMAAGTGRGEHARTIDLLSARLAPFRRVEGKVLYRLDEEFASLVASVVADDRAQTGRLLMRYHRRRVKAASLILSACA